MFCKKQTMTNMRAYINTILRLCRRRPKLSSLEIERFYVHFEQHFRGSRHEIRKRQLYYLPYAEQAVAQTGCRKAVDIGSGRGEWLELLGEAGLDGLGIEPNSIFRDACQNLGLQTVAADGIKFLQRCAPDSLSLVTAFHVAEHLPFERLLQLVQAAYRVLKPGGCLILETPNPNCLQVGASSFYTDPTHQRPIVPATLDFMLLHQGFERRRVAELHPPTERLPRKTTTGMEPLIAAWNAGRDYGVIGFKPGATTIAPPLRYRIEGPFDSSYSLALLNREMARALNQRHPGEVALHSTEGGGDFEPDTNFIDRMPDVAAMWRHSPTERKALVVGRNLYPPRVSEMHGALKVMTAYGWEESLFPWEYVTEFNRHLDGVTVMSSYVKKLLIDSGVTVPIHVVGLGVDHILRATPVASPVPLGDGFRFLHISSCFPRKGVDLLLRAYFNSFTCEDPVTLVIKTFPNPHNQVDRLLAELRQKHPNAPDVVLINEDLPDGVLRTLYQSCHCLVAPSRGEGFGLPLAEAMLHDLPVITTGYGGQTDFCNDQTAWLIAYDFAYAQTHMGQFASVWVEPRLDALQAQLQEVYRLHHEEPAVLRGKTSAARSLAEQEFSWNSCAQRFEETLQKLKPGAERTRPLKLGWVSSWNTRCGIAAYSAYLLQQLEPDWFDTLILASHCSELIETDGPEVRRCWTQDPRIPQLDEIREQLETHGAEVVVIQFNFGFFNLQALARLLESLLARQITVVLCMHSVTDVQLWEETVSLNSIATTLRRVDRILVHGVADLNQLRKFIIEDNVTLFPQGVSQGGPSDRITTQQALGITGKTVIGSYGFLLPHKGIPELIEAFGLLQADNNTLHLLLVNARYPHPSSDEVLQCCQDTITRLKLEEAVTLISDYLPERQSQALLAACDLIVYPYQATQESSSAAVRQGIATGQPVACTPLDIFADVSDVVHCLPGTTPALLAQGINGLLREGTVVLEAKKQCQQDWIKQHDWQLLGKRLSRLLTAII